MSEPSITDVLESLKALTTKISAMEADLTAMKAKSTSPLDSIDSRRSEVWREPNFTFKHKRWDFPRFDGTTEPLLFLNKCEAYFRQYQTMSVECVAIAGYHLEALAQLWFTQLQEDEGAPPWGHFKDLVNLRFGPPLRLAPLFELFESKRTSTVEEYSNRFQALLPRTGRLDEKQCVELFTGGLLPPLSHTIQIHNPEMLGAAMSLARQVELLESSRVV